MKTTALLLLIVSGTFSAPDALAQHPLDYLHGSWEGAGTTSGMRSSVRFTWGPALGGRYTRLQIRNRMRGENDQEYLFEGIGYYQPSDEHTLTGVWIDSQGDVLPILATLEEQTLIATWGSEDSKQGRSEYRLLPDGTLEAIDSIRNDEGEWREFGRALLVRQQ
ncbi:MAG: hypothetical protein OEW68_08790 [Gammaproteobacteria bacterium]|nr:hypothetical protein [Gammaproteobacteria bacterium]MDH4314923.1 hypothetical protein [Gammaproteobacteria bacterium]MDH5214345.1 hypothetical protein [Gammaproteobacteria bacterium]MDH5500483.1 hypothetical protein [Gammaproteobacteria bacterium]